MRALVPLALIAILSLAMPALGQSPSPGEAVLSAEMPPQWDTVAGESAQIVANFTASLACAPGLGPSGTARFAWSHGHAHTGSNGESYRVEPATLELGWQSLGTGSWIIDESHNITITWVGVMTEPHETILSWGATAGGGSGCTPTGWSYSTEDGQLDLRIAAAALGEGSEEGKDSPAIGIPIALGLLFVAARSRRLR